MRQNRIPENHRNYKKRLIAAAFLILLTLVCGCRERAVVYESGELSAAGQEALTEPAPEETEDLQETAETVWVYVCGEVANPGLYELTGSARIGDAVSKAGGMTENASTDTLNLAGHIEDGQMIRVLSKEAGQALLQAEEQAASGVINLNQASEQELMTLPGIGASKAREIISYRDQHGSFSEITELMEIPGIKEGVFNKIKDQITV